VGRIRYLGVLLYDAGQIESAASSTEDDAALVEQQLNILLDPFDSAVINEAKSNGVPDTTIKAAQDSPVYKFVKEWGLALPLHPEFRTLPMLFYVPPLLPVMASLSTPDTNEQAKKIDPMAKVWNDNWLYNTSTEDLWGTIDQARFPLKYMANLFSAGDEAKIAHILKKLMAVRIHRRDKTVGDIDQKKVKTILQDVKLTPETADQIYYLTSLASFTDRFVIPAAHREQAMEMLEFTGDVKGSTGFGFKEAPERGV
jgi:nitrate reductase beta subunit